MRHVLTIILSVLLSVLAVVPQLRGQPEPALSTPPVREKVGPPGPGAPPRGRPGEPVRRMREMAAQLEKQLDADLQWLREQGVEEYAARVDELRRGDAPGKHLLLWQIHRRIEQLRRLGPEAARQALEEIRLDFQVLRLATQYRAAAEPQRDDLRDQLRQAVERQFDLRLNVQRGIMANVRGRLEGIRKSLQRQNELQAELIERRLATLSDPSVPLPEPWLTVWPDFAGPGAGPSGEAEAPHKPPKRGGPEGRDSRPPQARPGEMQRTEGRGDEGRPRERGPGARRGWTGQLDQAIERNIAWLREHGLEEFAARVEEIRDSDDVAGKRVLLWRIHRRVSQLRELAGDEARRAIEEMRLEFAAVRVARQLRESEEPRRGELAAELKQLLEQQFNARLEAQRAIIQAITRKLEAIRTRLEQQERFREELIERQMKRLTDPSQPLPEPQLVPPPDVNGD